MASASSATAASLASSNTAPASWIAADMNRSTALQIQAAKRRGDWVEAIKLLTPLLDSASTSQPPALSASSLLTPAASGLVNLRYQRAVCAFRLDEYNAALSDCDRVLRVKPLLIDANSLRVKCLLGLRRYQEAEEEITKLSQRDALEGASHFDSMQQLWQRIRLERQGQYDMAAIGEESFSLLTPSGPCDMDELRRSRNYPCVRLGPHADYLNPAVECAVPITGKGRGTRVRGQD